MGKSLGKLGQMPQFSSVETFLPHLKNNCKYCHKTCHRRPPPISLSRYSLAILSLSLLLASSLAVVSLTTSLRRFDLISASLHAALGISWSSPRRRRRGFAGFEVTRAPSRSQSPDRRSGGSGPLQIGGGLEWRGRADENRVWRRSPISTFNCSGRRIN